MSQKTQKDVNEQEFDFIINQNNADNNVPQKKGLDKKIIIIIVLCAVTLIIFVVSFFIGANKKVVNSKTSSSGASVARQQQADDVVDQFFEKAISGNYNDAYSFFSTNTNISKEVFLNISVPFLESLDISSCSTKEQKNALVDSKDNILRTYSCTRKDGKSSVDIEFALSSDSSGQLSIYSAYIVGVS